MTSPITIRDACRRRMALGGPDAQCLEHALTMTERELAEARAEAARLKGWQREILSLSVRPRLTHTITCDADIGDTCTCGADARRETWARLLREAEAEGKEG
jgi:hypothetical protein